MPRPAQVICSADEKVCSRDTGSLYCSFGGSCIEAAGDLQVAYSAAVGPAAAAGTSSAILGAPVLTLNGPDTVVVDMGRAYKPCVGVLTSGCELGATATASAPGDFNNNIRACEDQVGRVRTRWGLQA